MSVGCARCVFVIQNPPDFEFHRPLAQMILRNHLGAEKLATRFSMKPISKNQKKKVVQILTEAFISNRSCQYVVGKNQRNIELLMKYSLVNCEKNGKVFISDDERVCVLILYPGKKKFSINLLFWELRLAFFGIGIFNLPKVLKREGVLKKMKFKGDHIYLWFIATQPGYQGRGEGKKALDFLIEYSKKEKLPILLETSTFENLPFYEGKGFLQYAKTDEFGFEFFFYKYEYVWD